MKLEVVEQKLESVILSFSLRTAPYMASTSSLYEVKDRFAASIQ